MPKSATGTAKGPMQINNRKERHTAMHPITDVKVLSNKTPVQIPERGFYIDMHYMYGDADGDKDTSTGPFPDDKKDLLIEFMNVLNEMVEMDDTDDYCTIANYDRWFDASFHGRNLTPEQTFRKNLNLQIEYTPDGWSTVARLTGWDVYYYDGTSLDKYQVELSF